MKEKNRISPAVVKRLPVYRRYLENLINLLVNKHGGLTRDTRLKSSVLYTEGTGQFCLVS